MEAMGAGLTQFFLPLGTGNGPGSLLLTSGTFNHSYAENYIRID